MNPPYLPIPRNIIIDVSNACNLRCKTCPQGQQLVMHPSRPMCLEDFIQLLDKLQELFPPVENVKGGRRNRKDRYKAYTDRAKNDWTSWLNNT